MAPASHVQSRGSHVLPFDERECVYQTLALRAVAVFPNARIPLSEKFFLLLLTVGTSGLAECIGISQRTLHRLLRKDGLGALELRTWARREALAILLPARTSQLDIARLTGFQSVATLQAFLRRELRTTSRDLRAVARYCDLATTSHDDRLDAGPSHESGREHDKVSEERH